MRRTYLKGAIALFGALVLGFTSTAVFAQTQTIKISHQFPGGTIDEGDFRDRLVRKFAAEVEKRTNGSLKFEIYPAASLMKAVPQYKALSTGALDMSLYPLAYAGGEFPEANLTLMPAVITSYEQGLRWKDAPIGKELTRLLDERNVKIITWVWQAGGIASKGKPVIAPDDSKGMKVRGGSREMDMMIKAAGGAVTNVASNEIYSAMQSGVLDAAITSSTSLISFRLHETSNFLTTGRKYAFWYMFEPLLMSKQVFDKLTPAQQKIVMEVGASLEKFGMEAAMADDQKVVEVFTKAGLKVSDMDKAAFDKWREVAKGSAWVDFEEKVKNGKQLFEMALSVK
ncbi:MAG: TRAP transporter substrate-binding protein DctP [Rhodocyclaceae bacterium]|nr:TRAP transporter substrate-binding protein DctP [Rhodocyclaceae bacterium]